MKKPAMLKDNARSPEQLERMRQLAKNKACFFCNDNYVAIGRAPAIRKTKHWYVRKNDYPYQGSVHHYLIAPHKHIRKVTDLTPAMWTELLSVFRWLERKLGVTGGSFFARSGDMRYTGATIDHLHFHFLVGGRRKKNGTLEDNILVTLGHKK